MTLCRSVLKECDILCELCTGTHSDVSDNSDDEILDSDSDAPQLVHVNNCNLVP